MCQQFAISARWMLAFIFTVCLCSAFVVLEILYVLAMCIHYYDCEMFCYDNYYDIDFVKYGNN